MGGLLYSFPRDLFSVILYRDESPDMTHVGPIWLRQIPFFRWVIFLFMCIFEKPRSHSLSPYRQMYLIPDLSEDKPEA